MFDKERRNLSMKKVIIFLSVLLVISLSGIIYIFNCMNEDIIYPGIYVDRIYVGEMNRESALNALKQKEYFGSLTLKYKSKEYKYNLEDIGFNIDYDAAVRSAYGIGRGKNAVSNFSEYVKLRFFKKTENVALSDTADFSYIFGEIKKINSENYVQSVSGSINVNNLQITPSKNGRKIKKDEAEKLVKESIKRNQDVVVDLPIMEFEPELTTEMLSHINTKLGEYSTAFSGSGNRSKNIALAARAVNGSLIKPGEEFSFNKTTGKRELKDGYLSAGIIVNGVYDNGVAGGVCQVSSTLYNAALYAGMKITLRNNHSIPSGYCPIGRDATVMSGDLDLRFKNPYQYPVLIKGFTSGNRVYFEIYGDAADKKDIRLSSEVTSRKGNSVNSVTYITVNGETRVLNRDHYPKTSGHIQTAEVPAKPVPSAQTAKPEKPKNPAPPSVDITDTSSSETVKPEIPQNTDEPVIKPDLNEDVFTEPIY